MKKSVLSASCAASIAYATAALALPFTPTQWQKDGTVFLQTKLSWNPGMQGCRIKEFLPYDIVWGWKNTTIRNAPASVREHILLLLPENGIGEPVPIGLVEVPGAAFDGGPKNPLTTDGNDRNVGNDFTVTWTADPFPTVEKFPLVSEVDKLPLDQIQNTMDSANAKHKDLTQKSHISRFVHVSLTRAQLQQCNIYGAACPCVSSPPNVKKATQTSRAR